jgi:hypothetical protein
MGFVAKITAYGNGDNFKLLTANSYELHPFEPMLKICDFQTGLWTAFYLRPTSTGVIRSDPYAEYAKAFSSPGAVRRFLAGLAQFRDPDFRSQAYAHVFGRTISGPHAYVLAVSEQEAFGQGSVAENEVGDILLEWNISDAVVSSIGRSLDRFAKWAGGSLTRADGDLRNRLWTAAHHSGGCRIAADPRHGVVDDNLRVHGTDRIYVCDGSVLPSTGASNTGLTIGSLALRLADHISKAVVHEAARTSRGLPTILISGATGHVARMVLPALARSGFTPQPMSLRKRASSPELRKAAVFLHLANAAESVKENISLQQRTAEVLAVAKIDQIIIPQSFATLQTPSPKGPDPGAVNFGFGVKFCDPYVLGKLAAEEFWIEWQRQRPERRVALLYVPTILGPHSAWTRTIATHCEGRPIWIPGIPRFFSVTEEHLAKSVVGLCRYGLPRGTSRSLVFDRSESLAEAVAWDRGGDDVREIRLPSAAWHAISLSRFDLANKFLNKMLRLTNKSLRSKFAVLPVPPFYYAIFESLNRSARALEEAAVDRSLASTRRRSW